MDGDQGTFDAVHSEYSKYINLYVPFYAYIHRVWNDFRIRNPGLVHNRSPILPVLIFYMKLLAFLKVDIVRKRYLDIKRIFQTDISSDFWMTFEDTFIRDDTHILKWSVISNSEDQKLIFAINRHQEKSVQLISEVLRPSAKDNDNLGNLIEGV